MKSLLLVKIFGIDYYTHKNITFTMPLECNGINFVDRISPAIKINNNINTLPPTVITAKEQADEWLNGQKEVLRSIMYDTSHELFAIRNWDIIAIENIDDNNKTTAVLIPTKKEKLTDIEKISIVFSRLEKEQGEFTENFKNNFLHTFTEMEDVLKGIPLERKILITLRSMGVGLQAAITAYDRILEILVGTPTKLQLQLNDGIPILDYYVKIK